MHGPLTVKMICTFRLSDIILTTKYSSSLMLLFRIQDSLFLIVTCRSAIVFIYFFSPSKQNKPSKEGVLMKCCSVCLVLILVLVTGTP